MQLHYTCILGFTELNQSQVIEGLTLRQAQLSGATRFSVRATINSELYATLTHWLPQIVEIVPCGQPTKNLNVDPCSNTRTKWLPSMYSNLITISQTFK